MDSLHHGYWIVGVPKQLRRMVGGAAKVGEHRLVMARHLGRPLLPDEVVHHRNGVRTDNRIENLELWSRRIPRDSGSKSWWRSVWKCSARYASEIASWELKWRTSASQVVPTSEMGDDRT